MPVVCRIFQLKGNHIAWLNIYCNFVPRGSQRTVFGNSGFASTNPKNLSRFVSIFPQLSTLPKVTHRCWQSITLANHPDCVQTHWAKSEPSRHPILTFFPAKNYCSVRTHWPESEPSRHPILTLWPAKNYCTVPGLIGPNPNHPDTRFWHSCLLEIIAQCPDTLGRIRTIQTPDSNILSC